MGTSLCNLRACCDCDVSFNTISQPFRARRPGCATVNLRAQFFWEHVVKRCEVDNPGQSGWSDIGRGVEGALDQATHFIQLSLAPNNRPVRDDLYMRGARLTEKRCGLDGALPPPQNGDPFPG